MGKKLQNKAETITIRVTEETRNQAESMYRRSGTSATFASFLGDMVNFGIKVKEKIEAHINVEVEKIAHEESVDYRKEFEELYVIGCPYADLTDLYDRAKGMKIVPRSLFDEIKARIEVSGVKVPDLYKEDFDRQEVLRRMKRQHGEDNDPPGKAQ